MNAVNLPLVLFTVILRRFIDKFRTTTPGSSVAVGLLQTTSPWLVDTSLFKSCMYAYMFFAGIYYTLKHMQRGTIVSLARKCSQNAVTIKDRYVRKGNCLNNNKSCLIRNLARGRDGQQRALRYMAAMTPRNDALQSVCSNMLADGRDNHDPSAVHDHPQEFDQELANPYFQPATRYCYRSIPSFQQLHGDCTRDETAVDTIMEPRSNREFKETTPGEMEAITVSDELQGDLMPARYGPVTKRPKQRNCLTLRGRKIVKNDLSFHGDKIVRKTRSGKVYGYHYGGLSGKHRRGRKKTV